MDLLAPVRLPLRAAQLAVRALDDLNTLAERARRDPDPVDEARERLDVLATLLDGVIAEAAALRASVAAVDETGQRIIVGGDDLRRVAEALGAVARALVTGGAELVGTGERLDEHTVELISGGKDLTGVAGRLDEDLRVFRAALPRLMQGLDAVEQLEDSVETVAETVEPLQGAAERVGRVTQRFSRSS